MTTIQIYPDAEDQNALIATLNPVAAQFMAHAANTSYGILNDPKVRTGFIDDVGEVGYQVIAPLPYRIERANDGGYIARIEPANIGISGTSWHDAYQALIAELLDTFDTLRAEANLGAGAAEQLAILNDHILKT